MRLESGSSDVNTPDLFTERLLQAQLAQFWCPLHSSNSSKFYDVNARQAKYKDFCVNFLSILHPAFGNASSTWDEALPFLSRQRLRLHVSIYDSICWHFRPALLLDTNLVASMPPWKQMLVSSQRKTLAAVAMRMLEAISSLHTLLGSSPTRLADIPQYSFEASVMLVLACAQNDIGQNSSPVYAPGLAFAGTPLTTPTKYSSRSAIRDALQRLQSLANISAMAAMGARVLADLLNHTADEIWKDKDRISLIRSTPGPVSDQDLEV